MSRPVKPRVFSIPPDVAFLPALASAVLEGRLFDAPPPTGTSLGDWTILLPTRRAARAMREAFMHAAPGTTRILPAIRTLGDPDEDELLISSKPDEFDLPPAAPDIERQFLLAGLVRAWAEENPHTPAAEVVAGSMTHALRMATALMQLIDTIENGDVSLGDVPHLLTGFAELPLHHEDALAFLSTIATKYPEALGELERMDQSARRNALIRMEAVRLAEKLPDAPVIAAGSTGSLRATAALLKTISRLPKGCVVLPGLDQTLDAPSWSRLGDQHPQFGLSELLQHLELERSDVPELPGISRTPLGQAREQLVSELMRPVQATHLWKRAADRSDQLQKACEGLALVEASEMHQQAAIVALAMRKALAEKRKCALVTPDRQLAKRVAAELARWNVHVDDSAGEALSMQPAGSFFSLVAAAASTNATPEAVTGLLGHPLMAASGPDAAELSRQLELVLMRPVLGGHHLCGLRSRMKHARQLASQQFAHTTTRRLAGPESWQAIEAYAARLEAVFSPLLELAGTDTAHPVADLLTAHIKVAEALVRGSDEKAGALWQGEAGAKLSELLRQLLDHAAAAPRLTFEDYRVWLSDLMDQQSVRRRYPLHPDLSILGLLEARLVQPEFVILAGLNEGTWPALQDPGPWLSRPQQRMLNLQLPERRLGLAAHDFSQSMCAEQVMLVWARKSGGTPLVPSRWILRLQAVLKVAGIDEQSLHDETLPAIAGRLDAAGSAAPLPPIAPSPTPPLVFRPTRLSVTRVDRLLHDPYWAYAYYVLALRPLEPLGQVPGPRERGQLAHKTLERFSRTWPDALPDDVAGELQKLLAEDIEADIENPALRAVWQHQLSRAMAWFAAEETRLRKGVVRVNAEAQGHRKINIDGTQFEVSAKADRIDLFEDGQARIVDYKTGRKTFSKRTAKEYSPQLDLEGWILQAGGFSGLPKAAVRELMYIRVSGGHPPGEVIEPGKNDSISERIKDAGEGFYRLMAAYMNENLGYRARAGDEAWQRRSDYDHLSRWREWGLGRDVNTSGEDS